MADTRSAFRIPEVPAMPSFPASFFKSGSSIAESGWPLVVAPTVVVSLTVDLVSFQD